MDHEFETGMFVFFYLIHLPSVLGVLFLIDFNAFAGFIKDTVETQHF